MAAVVAKGFHPADYVVFFGVLVVSAGVGLFYAFSGGKQKTQSEYLLANREMKALPVSASLMVSFISAILILGVPAEVYTRGIEFVLTALGMSLSCLFTCLLFIPLLYPLKLTSSYEYLEKRFKSRSVKMVGTLTLITSQILYIGIATYSPSTALEAVTGFPVYASIICVGVVATFYTTLGGMKAVVWTDAFQTVIMIGGLLAVVIMGSIKVGGIDKVWKISLEGGRLDLFDFDPDPTKRHSFWSLIVGTGMTMLSVYGANQVSVQRYSSLPSINQAKLAVLLTAPGILFFITITCLAGIVMYAYYAEMGCDPLKRKYISNSNQLLPYFVMDVMSYPAMPGLFTATLFSGALSSISSSLNAMAAITWEDFLKIKLDHLPEIRKTIITKIVVFVYGCAGVAMAFGAQSMGGTVIQASLSFTGTAGGPLLGLFLLGGLFPCANWIGAVTGGVLGLVFPMWLSIGAYVSKLTPESLHTSIESCFNITYNATLAPTSEARSINVEDLTGIDKLYTLSYLWFPSVGIATVVVVGLLVSCLTGFTQADEVEPELIIPMGDWLCCCLPGDSRRVMRCGLERSEETSLDNKAQYIRDEEDGPTPYGKETKLLQTSSL